MTRRTFIAFLTALLPANWLRSSDAPVAAGYRRSNAFTAHPTPPKHFVAAKVGYQRVNALTGLPQTEAERVADVRRFIAKRMQRDLLGEPITGYIEEVDCEEGRRLIDLAIGGIEGPRAPAIDLTADELAQMSHEEAMRDFGCP